jgi:group I intron endonuclease
MVMTIYYIYKITNKINNKMYIGKSKNPASRFVRHLKISKNLSINDNHFQAIHGAIKKYGEENFVFEIIESCDSENASTKEKYWISNLKTQNKEYGYNLTSGGDGVQEVSQESINKRRVKMIGRKHSAEHNKKISESNKGKIISEEVREKISLSNCGANNGMFGKSHSSAAKQKMSKIQSTRKRRPLTEEERLKISKALKGKPRGASIPNYIKNNIIKDYLSGDYTKKQLSEKFDLKYNSIVKIIRMYNRE